MKGGTFFAQLWIMLHRNVTMQLRYWRSTFAQCIGAPVLFILLLYLLQQVDYSLQQRMDLHPNLEKLSGVSNCRGKQEGDPCINLLFSPMNENTTAFMKAFSIRNSQRTGQPPWKLERESPLKDLNYSPNSMDGILPVESEAFIYDYALNHPNVTKWAVTFVQSFQPNPVVQYQIWYNASLLSHEDQIFAKELVSFLRGMDEAIMSVINDPTLKVFANLDVSLKDWPTVPAFILSDRIVQNLGPMFFFCCVMVIFISTLNQIVTEKETHLRKALETMGLWPSVYWISYFLSISIVVASGSLVTVILGLVCDFKVFTQTHISISFLTFFLFGESTIAFAFFLSTFISKSRTAVLAAIFVFVIGLLFESFVFSSGFVGYVWWRSNQSFFILCLLYLVPFFNFGKMFLDITTYTTGKRDELTDTFIPGPGFSWRKLYEPLPLGLLPYYESNTHEVPRPVQSWYLLILNIVMYLVLTWYLDSVIPDAFGSYRPWYFIVSPQYCGLKKKEAPTTKETWLKRNKQVKNNEDKDEDSDVKTERRKALDPQNWPAVKIVNLRKEYINMTFGCFRKGNTRVAVDNICANLEEGKVLALLGPNGAGKTTTISILSGFTPATSGDARIYGYSVKSQMSQIRKIMGTCPQHDMLFNDLTAREHIELYAGLKGINPEVRKRLAQERLEIVKLDTVADVRVGKYSGGMRRRLSVVISTIGDPKIIFLDQPTAGMDPVNRHQVWSFIEKFKHGRVIVLTTHSMEEAVVLGDRIAIMAHGSFKAMGTSLQLKNKFGTGYRISIVAEDENIPIIKEAVSDQVPEAKLEDENAGTLVYHFPLSTAHAIPAFVAWLEEAEKSIVKNWDISQSTLEEVFLKLIKNT